MEEREEAPPGTGRGRWWIWAAAALILAAVVGTAIGIALGTRGSPLAASGGAGGRPTIVVATPAVIAAAPSVSVVPRPSASPSAVSSAVASAESYVVKPGDTLRSIAEDRYGDASQWPRIYDANRDVIGPDPDALNAGTTLTIPR
jgi:nucleoid-associated protein YgaU